MIFDTFLRMKLELLFFAHTEIVRQKSLQSLKIHRLFKHFCDTRLLDGFLANQLSACIYKNTHFYLMVLSLLLQDANDGSHSLEAICDRKKGS